MYLRAYAQGRKLAAGCNREVIADDAAYRVSAILTAPLVAFGGAVWICLNRRFPTFFAINSMPSLAYAAFVAAASIAVFFAVPRTFGAYAVSTQLIDKYKSPKEKLIRAIEVMFAMTCWVVLGIVVTLLQR
jgi:hypothetical protein